MICSPFEKIILELDDPVITGHFSLHSVKIVDTVQHEVADVAFQFQSVHILGIFQHIHVMLNVHTGALVIGILRHAAGIQFLRFLK